ncbi:MAG TPA: nuclear transport factor 2 family protein [Candidatus Binatia bacterium]|jgi:ketosteroid isomerase-like protein|nr:nuclear transport factor 2 family protein [Candidatus Binatia bacterium]
MTADEQDVANANLAFYRAFESLDIKRMESLWVKDGEIQCGHPGWRILRGWKPVMESWRRIFENTPSIHFTLTDVKIEIHGELAWVTLYENLNSIVEGQKVSASILATNIFQKSSDGWRMIHHHGSTVAQSPPDDETPTVH